MQASRRAACAVVVDEVGVVDLHIKKLIQFQLLLFRVSNELTNFAQLRKPLCKERDRAS